MYPDGRRDLGRFINSRRPSHLTVKISYNQKSFTETQAHRIHGRTYRPLPRYPLSPVNSQVIVSKVCECFKRFFITNNLFASVPPYADIGGINQSRGSSLLTDFKNSERQAILLKSITKIPRNGIFLQKRKLLLDKHSKKCYNSGANYPWGSSRRLLT